MFKVYENDNPAVLTNGKYDCWKNCEYETFSEAVIYARKWLGIYEPGEYYCFQLERPYEFAEGCFVVIKELGMAIANQKR